MDERVVKQELLNAQKCDIDTKALTALKILLIDVEQYLRIHLLSVIQNNTMSQAM